MTCCATDFLPATASEMQARGWRELDVLLVTGDAYFDHPSHGAALIGRVLEHAGYRVGIIARPDWKSTADFVRMGRPRLFAGVTAGAVDSMLNNYTADRRRRRSDAYALENDDPGRPNLATAVYAARMRESFPGLPIILGGIEASTRRFSYYDYMKEKIRRSLLVDTRADLLVFGAGETQVLQIAARIAAGAPLDGIRGTARLLPRSETPTGEPLPDHESLVRDPALLIDQTRLIETHSGPERAQAFYQRYVEGVVQCEPPAEMSAADFDAIAALPFTRTAHPACRQPPSALETVRWSVIATRGCPGGCSFCALSMHQGRKVLSRSAASIIGEVQQLSSRADFKGIITDIGGPTANAWGSSPRDRDRCRECTRPSCTHPQICSNLNHSQDTFAALLNTLRNLPRVRRVFVASGIRHDLALQSEHFIEELAIHHTGGHLKVAPEHVHPDVLRLMRKPPIEVFERFEKIFLKASARAGLRQFIVPYFIAGFPGCRPFMADSTSQWLKQRGQKLEQMQTFIPLPGTMAAAMYAAKRDVAGNPLYVADDRERRRQKQIMITPQATGSAPTGTATRRHGKTGKWIKRPR